LKRRKRRQVNERRKPSPLATTIQLPDVLGMKMTVGLNSRVLTAVSVLLVRDGYVFLSQRGPFDGVFQGCWQNVFSNVAGTESALAVATRKIRSSTGIHLRHGRLHLQGKTSLVIDPEHSCRLLIFRAILDPGEVPRRRQSKLPTWIPFPVEELPSLRPMTPALRCSLEFLPQWDANQTCLETELVKPHGRVP
jgi:hypothetical protein